MNAGDRIRSLLAASPAAGSEAAAWHAVATLYHAYFTGLLLTIASRRGAAAAGRWTFAVFRRQHHEKFLSSFEKLGLADLPHAVASAQYHYLSNTIGGVGVEFMRESDRKAWVRFRHPRWLYEGTALCGMPLEVSHGFLRGWYAHNGVSLRNPGLRFVCTSQDMDGGYGLAGYFEEMDRALQESERLTFAPGEEPPPFDAAAAPSLDPAVWTEERLRRANRNYAMEYVRNGLIELVALFGPMEGAALGRMAGELIGRQYHHAVARALAVESEGAAAFADLMTRFSAGQGDSGSVSAEGDAILVAQRGWRLMRGSGVVHPAVIEAWHGLWTGMLSAHDRFLTMQTLRRPDWGDEGFAWRILPRSAVRT